MIASFVVAATVAGIFGFVAPKSKSDHCGQCGDFPCGDYIEFVGDLEHHKKAMAHLFSLRGKP